MVADSRRYSRRTPAVPAPPAQAVYQRSSSPRMAASSCSRSVLAACSSRSEVAVGTGSSARPSDTLTPIPTTIAPAYASARIPAIFRPATSTSLGHFSWAGTAASARSALATATPASSGTQPRAAGGAAGRSSTEQISAVPGRLTQVRPSRPRPAVCAPATSTRPSAAPARAAWSRSALVEPVSATTRISRHRPPGLITAWARVFWSSPGTCVPAPCRIGAPAQPVFCRPAATPLTASSSSRCSCSRRASRPAAAGGPSAAARARSSVSARNCR